MLSPNHQDTRRDILFVLEPYINKMHGRNRYNTPWRNGADGGTLSVEEDDAYGLGLKWYDHKDNEHGNGWTLIAKLAEAGIIIDRPPPETDRPAGAVLQVAERTAPYTSLAEYAARHGVSVDVLESAGWHEVKRGRGHLAFAFPTDHGTRYRYADEHKAGRKYDHDKGYTPCWYGLDRAIALARRHRAPLILCNGEASTLVAHYYGLPACCVTGGERGSMREDLIEELREAWDGSILVAYDSDKTGRKAAPALATQLRSANFDAAAIDLGESHGFDLADFCRLHQGDALQALTERPEITISAPDGKSNSEYVVDWKASGVTAAQLQHAEFPPEVWVIEGILPTGACLLAAKPKKGKSWLALQAAICVATGRPFLGRIPVTKGRVLYLDLEGTQRRIKKRLRAMLGAQREPWPENLHVFTEWPQGPEGLAQLEAWLMAYPDTVLIIIDVLASFRRPMDMREAFYQYDRETVKPINDLAERYDAAAFLVHHMNKTRTDNIFETISGSTGLISVTNTQWAMGSDRDDPKLLILSMQGRDLENTDALGMRWDDYAHMHMVEGTAAELTVSIERRAILDALDDDEPYTPKEIAENIGKPVNAVKQLLTKMLNDGQVDKAGYGKWVRVLGRKEVSMDGLAEAQRAALQRAMDAGDHETVKKLRKAYGLR